MKILTGLFLCFLTTTSLAQSLSKSIESAFDRFLQDDQLTYSSSSFTVINSLTGEIIYSKNGNMGLAPASTLKTVTSATAFHVLGNDFSWETNLGYNGSISTDGILNGDLIIKGAGDPTLGSWRYNETKSEVILKKWKTAIENAGIRKITGRIIADDSLFGTQTLPDGWIWQDIGNYYGAGPNGLTWHENQTDIKFIPGNKVGELTKIKIKEMEISGVRIINEVTTGPIGSGDNVYAYSSPFSDFIYLRGTYGMDLKKQISISVPDPAKTLGIALQKTLEQSGINIDHSAITARELKRENSSVPNIEKLISIHTSPNLDQVVYWFNQKSINLYGEHLVKTIAWKSGKEISTENGVEEIRTFWKNKLGINKEAVNIVDGSGLSPGNRITTLAIAQILSSTKKEPWFKAYFDSFPIYNNMKMKSGSINGVLAYAGFQNSSSGTPLAFSIIINNYNGSASAVKQKMYKVLDELK
ncbi:MAG: D-alanyl-D-alanine carboxypeptidase/D-alanyl-D-alanine-endopeptidase [Daejeonella sp.]